MGDNLKKGLPFNDFDEKKGITFKDSIDVKDDLEKIRKEMFG